MFQECKFFFDCSADIGNTQLITMDIDTGDNHALFQTPYTLPLRYAVWVQQERK